MKRFIAIGLLVIAGCVPIPLDNTSRDTPNESFMAPGFYFATGTCEREGNVDGEFFSDTLDIDFPLVVSENGIPMRLGEEEYVGRTEEETIAGMTFLATITEVSVFSNGILIRVGGNVTSGIDTVLFSQVDVYSPLRNGQIGLTSDMSIGGTAGGISFSIVGECKTIYSQ